MSLCKALGLRLALALLVLPLAEIAEARAAGPSLVVYSARKYQLVEQVFADYEKLRGIEVKYVSDDGAPLIQRLIAEGRNSPADVLMTVDAGDLWRATEAGLLAAVRSRALESAIPAHLRDPRGRWFGLAVRARTIAYSAERVKPTDLSTYMALGDARWKGKLCLRSGKHVYNQSLVAMMIAEVGEQATENLVRSWIANLAAEPFSSDTLLLNAIAAGQCDVGVVNSYYLGRLQNEKPGFPVQIFWADQQAGGTHVNISGAGVMKHAKNRAEAIRFLEWLATPEIQARFTRANFEYAANPEVAPAPVVAAWGPFKHKLVNVGRIGALQPAAVRLMDRAGWR